MWLNRRLASSQALYLVQADECARAVAACGEGPGFRKVISAAHVLHANPRRQP